MRRPALTVPGSEANPVASLRPDTNTGSGPTRSVSQSRGTEISRAPLLFAPVAGHGTVRTERLGSVPSHRTPYAENPVGVPADTATQSSFTVTRTSLACLREA